MSLWFGSLGEHSTGFFVRMLPLCAARSAVYSTRLSVKALSLLCGNPPPFHQYLKLLLFKTSTRIFAPSPSRPSLARFWSRFLIAGFSDRLSVRSILSSLAPYKAQALAWPSFISFINGTKHAMILDHHCESAC